MAGYEQLNNYNAMEDPSEGLGKKLNTAMYHNKQNQKLGFEKLNATERKDLKEYAKEQEKILETLRQLRNKHLNALKKLELEKDLANLKLAHETKLANMLGELKEKAQLEDLLINEQEDLHDRRNKERTEAWRDEMDDAVASFGEEFGDMIGGKLLLAFINLRSQLETTMDSFLSTLEAIAYNLNGSTSNLGGVVENLTKALGSSGIVKQLAVYENLLKLVEDGIIENVELRAYLQTLSDDLGMNFSVQSKALNRLILLLGEDLTANRMAIQASLKTFLNQNYQTSQYIKEGFESVSDALLEAQALMDSTSAIRVESTLQKWMGSLSSAGMSTETINKLAEAVGQLGSGNVNALNGTEMQRLLIMGANEVNKSYTEVLLEGLTEGNVDSIMGGAIKYIREVIGSADNNVVMSELARVFGLSVSDVVAAQNVNITKALGQVSSDINTALLSKFDEYQYGTTYLENALQNFMYSWGTGIASDELQYTIYKSLSLISDLAAAAIDGTTLSTAPLGVGTTINLSLLISAIPMVTATAELLPNLGNIFTNSNGSAASVFSILGGITGNTKTTADIFGGLGTSDRSSSVVINSDKGDIKLTAKTSAQAETENMVTEEELQKSTNDIYDLLGQSDERIKNIEDKFANVDLKKYPYSELYNNIKDIADAISDGIKINVESIVIPSEKDDKEDDNTGTVINAGDDVSSLNYIDKSIISTAFNVLNIYSLLYNNFKNSSQEKIYRTTSDTADDYSANAWYNSLTWTESLSNTASLGR